MATVKRGFLVAALFLSALAVILVAGSLGTRAWVVADLVQRGELDLRSPIQLGLFWGDLVRRSSTVSNDSFSLTLTCLPGNNVCSWSCQPDSSGREKEVQSLFDSGTLDKPEVDMLQACRKAVRRSRRATDVGTTKVPTTPMVPTTPTTTTTTTMAPVTADRRFTNFGLWLTTVLSVVLALLLGLSCVLLTGLNLYTSPVEPLVAVFGLFVWNGVAAGFCLLALVLWGTQYAVTYVHTVTYSEVIMGSFVTYDSELGYSYWLMLGALLVHIANEAVLCTRKYLINREPPTEEPIKMDQGQDGAMFLY